MRLRLAALAVLVLLSTTLAAEEPWDRAPFTADPKELLAAAEKIGAGEHGLVVLLDEEVYTFEAEGKSTSTTRLVYRIVDESGVEDLDQITAPWAPWYDERPIIEARVVTKDGTVHTLDKSAVTEAPASPGSLDIFSDERLVRAPLPAVGVGSVVEYVVTRRSNSPLADAGLSKVFSFGWHVPMHRARLVLDTPLSLQPRVVNKSDIQPKTEEKDGRRRIVYESGRIEPLEHWEGHLAFDDTNRAYVSFSTGTSWGDIARRYSDVVDKQIAGSDLQKMTRAAVGNATDRRQIVARILAAIQKEIRYAGVEVGEGSIVPRSPRTVLANKYGDCKDKATLLVAMLRQAGLEAHVALLRAGDDFDVQQELPGLGLFNHAIVVVPGEPAIWVDPTDVYARAGELPIADQGRLALVAAAGTTSLTRTPETPSTANLSREVRTFVLPEDGKARVTETSFPGPTNEPSWRRYAAESERKTYREQMESYAQSHYHAKKLEKLEVGEPRALDKPFTISLEVSDSRSGIVANGEAAVAINPASFLASVPESLRDWEEPSPNDTAAEKKAKERKRKHDFLFPEPTLREWVYRITPPIGYTPRPLPENDTRRLGTTTVTKEFALQSDGVVVATLRFDSGKRRISAAEFDETRVALSKFAAEPQFTIGFEQIGQTRLAAGDVGGSLEEFRRLAALHPKEAQHHIELARALLAGGLGEAAREEARLAIKLEPQKARAHEMLGFVLQHDLLGRALTPGSDLAGAAAALRKAKELAPDEAQIRYSLVKVLSYGDDGQQFGRNARLAETIDEVRQLVKDFGADGKGYESDLLLPLAYLGRFDEMKEVAAGLQEEQQRDLGRILAVAATEGGPAAVRELERFAVATRRNYAVGAGGYLMKLRLYPQAVQLLELGHQGTPNAAQMRPFLDLMRKTRRAEEVPVPEDARGVVQQLMLALLRGAEPKETAPFILPAAFDIITSDEESRKERYTVRSTEQMPLPVLIDFVLSNAQFQVDGNDANGYRVRVRTPGIELATSMYVVRENGKYLVAAANDPFDSIGAAVLRFVEAGNLEAARVWLNWMREDARSGDGDDPVAGFAFTSYWPKEKPTATADELRLGAAMFMLRPAGAKQSEPILLAAREKAESDAVRFAIDRTLNQIYIFGKQWAKVVPVAERLAAAHPDSNAAFTSLTTALSFTGAHARAEQLAKARLEKLPRDRDALRMLSTAAVEASDYVAAQKYAQRIIDEMVPVQNDYNHAAWLALFTGQQFETAIEHAQRATGDKDRSRADAAPMHTLAALYAETGKSLEARTALLESMELRNRTEPDGDDWYVLGRIAENYGVRDAALAAYRKVEKDEPLGTSTWTLASRRLTALGKK